ncbi:MAG TPA: STAS domain-containing protein [Thermoanaerobaculia bacterium]|jgi:anti-sigma B factor antagonist|nr:STAS domain-containing protein [Thermoanaerobaculia bacterium]
MEITTRRADDVVILDLKGKLVRGVGDELLRDAMDRLLADRQAKILINLSDVSFLDSSGIGELVASKKVAEQMGTSLKLMQLPERVKHTLKLSLILPLFETYPSEQAALAAFHA